MKIKSQKDFLSGLMFVAIGSVFAVAATHHEIGRGGNLGPGFFPITLGIILAILGSIITFKSLGHEVDENEKIGAIAWRPLIFIILANLLFGVFLGGLPAIGLPSMGLVISIFALTIVASYASDEFNFKHSLVLATILCLISYVAFILLLKLRLPVWPAIGA